MRITDVLFRALRRVENDYSRALVAEDHGTPRYFTITAGLALVQALEEALVHEVNAHRWDTIDD